MKEAMMQFHHHGYLSGDPSVQPAAGVGIDRPSDLPDEVDVLVIGSGPAGMLLGAQLSQYPTVVARVVEKREGRLAVGQADGIQPRSVETFQAFGFAERITAEAYNIGWMNFWGPDPDNPAHIARTSRTADYAYKISEFPHLIVNQARVLDYFAEAALKGPGRLTPDYGVEFVGLSVDGVGDHPVAVRVRILAGESAGTERTVRAKYVVGADGARSGVRAAIGRTHIGGLSAHAWGVMDVLVNTDFPDWRVKCAINAAAGNILLIPREGGYLCRVYTDLGEVEDGNNHEVRNTPLNDIVARTNAILAPYSIDVKDVAWHSVYEVGHRVTDRFDDMPDDGSRGPRVFLTGDACHTHSAKAGQGMNVSMQDGFNLGWKLGAVISGQLREEVLETYSAERQPVAQQLIDFDREWSTLMARKPGEITDPDDLANYYLATAEFPSGFRTQYSQSRVVGSSEHQHLASGFPVGMRFKSAVVTRAADGNAVHLGHHARADGRWRIYVFADDDLVAADEWALWAAGAHSPLAVFTPDGADSDSVFDVKVILPRHFSDVDVTTVAPIFRPESGPLGLRDWEKVYTSGATDWTETDIFAEREISGKGALVVVRPDQYVAAVLPLADREELGALLEAVFVGPQH